MKPPRSSKASLDVLRHARRGNSSEASWNFVKAGELHVVLQGTHAPRRLRLDCGSLLFLIMQTYATIAVTSALATNVHAAAPSTTLRNCRCCRDCQQHDYWYCFYWHRQLNRPLYIGGTTWYYYWHELSHHAKGISSTSWRTVSAVRLSLGF